VVMGVGKSEIVKGDDRRLSHSSHYLLFPPSAAFLPSFLPFFRPTDFLLPRKKTNFQKKRKKKKKTIQKLKY